ncbi:MAG TPA: hypothetical protein VGM44_02540, partial [Polyangiaceae bacterium]
SGLTTKEVPNDARDSTFDDYLVDWISNKTSPYQCSTLFRTDTAREMGLKSRHFLFDDVMAHFKIAAKYGALNVREIKASFRLHPGELTAQAKIREWSEESMDLLELMCELSPNLAPFIRKQGLQFLAVGNYRRALRLPRRARLAGCLTVLRTHHYTLPPKNMLTNAVDRRVRSLIQRLLPS